MPALPSVPNVLRLALKYGIGEDNAAQVRFFEQYTGATPTQAQLAALATQVASAWLTHLAVRHTPDRTLEEVTITDLTTPSSAVGVWSGANVGTSGQQPLPANIAVLESRRVVRRYRGGHCRTYWPMLGRLDMQDAQTWIGANLAGCATDLGAFNAEWEASPWSGGTIVGPVNVSFYQGFTVHSGVTGRMRNVSTPRATALIDPVISIVLQPGIAQQRKRLLALA